MEDYPNVTVMAAHKMQVAWSTDFCQTMAALSGMSDDLDANGSLSANKICMAFVSKTCQFVVQRNYNPECAVGCQRPHKRVVLLRDGGVVALSPHGRSDGMGD